MALPKRRHSKRRHLASRAQAVRLSNPAVSKCTQCGKPKLMHRVCPYCGYYNGVAVVVKKEKEKSAKGGSASGGKK